MEVRLPVWLDARRIPGLLALGLETEDFEALAQGGFVCEERRGERTLFKLRFRRDGRQRVVSLGTDARRAEAIRGELDLLQSLRRIGQLLREVNRALTEADRIWHTQVRLRLVTTRRPSPDAGRAGGRGAHERRFDTTGPQSPCAGRAAGRGAHKRPIDTTTRQPSGRGGTPVAVRCGVEV